MQLTELIKCLGNLDEIPRWTTPGSAVSFYWAKVGEAKLANPTRVITERIFMGSCRCFRTVCRPTTCCGILRVVGNSLHRAVEATPQGSTMLHQNCVRAWTSKMLNSTD